VKQWENQISIFHYAGHADSEIVALQNGEAFFEPLASELQSRNPDTLSMVFLNGCSTQAHVETLFSLGVKAVIATSCPIGDKTACDFAIRFYENLANGDSLKMAYESAAKYIKANRSEARLSRFGEIIPRGSGRQAPTNEFAWGLYLSGEEAEWENGGTRSLVERPFNEYLTRKLIEAICPISADANNFQNAAKQRNKDWEKTPQICAKGMEILVFSFVGIIGIELSKLQAIALEKQGETTHKKYIEKCQQIALNCLELLVFILVSSLWDQHKQGLAGFNETERETLRSFFERFFEVQDLKEHQQLLQKLQAIFERLGLPLPIQQLKDLQAGLAKDQPISKALEHLQAISERFAQQKSQPDDARQAEKSLAECLSGLFFLANYRMASIKTIGFQQIRTTPPAYIHRYTDLGIDRKANRDAEKVNHTTLTTNTDSVLLYQGNHYQNNINLSPFVIDYNALSGEGGAKICFFRNCDLIDNSLDFCFLEDGSKVNVPYKDVLAKNPNLNELLLDKNKSVELNLDSVVDQFLEAKRSLLGLEMVRN
jgi:hypothetical protein